MTANESQSRPDPRTELAVGTLTTADHQLVTIAAVACVAGRAELGQTLKLVLQDRTLSAVELAEAVLHFAVYAGWPKAAQLETTLRWAVAKVSPGALLQAPDSAGHPVNASTSAEALRIGRQSFAEVNLFEAPYADSPFFEIGLLQFVFGTVWSRATLSRRQRRLITLPAVAYSGVPAAVTAHVGSAISSEDIHRKELALVADVVARHCGPEAGERLMLAMAEYRQADDRPV